MNESYAVYARTDDAGRIIAINSSAFLPDVTGWVQIDEGVGDKYHHAQGNYLPGALVDARGICRYKLVAGKPAERTAAEMDADAVALAKGVPSEAERIAALEAAVLALMEV